MVPMSLVALAACGRVGFGERTIVGDAVDDADGAAGDASVPDGGTQTLPLLWFPFDEVSGTGSIANSGSLVTSLMATYAQQGVTGAVGRAIALAASTQGIVIPDQPALDGFKHLTVEGWMYFDAFNSVNYSTLAKKEMAYILRTCDVASCGPKKTVSWIVWDSTGTTHGNNADITPVLGTWYHVAGTYDGSVNPRVLKVYWNGALLNTVTYAGGTGAAFDSPNALVLGRQADSGEDLRGRLDDVKVWPITRSDAEICADAGRTWSGTQCN